MTQRKKTDEALQDYVDGRLGDAERAELERRLADDPELRGRLEDYRAIRGALREAPPDLPPGFYTRARARFEEAQRPQRRAWFRPLSWESLGVAAAAFLIAALFLPSWLQDEPAIAPASRQALPEDAVPLEELRDRVVGEKAVAAEPEAFAEPDTDQVERLRSLGYVAAESEKQEAAKEESADLAAPPMVLRESVEAEEGYVQRRQLVARDIAVDLPAGTIAAGDVQVIDDAGEWLRLVERLGAGLAALAPDFASERVVLIGERPSAPDCRATVVSTGDPVTLVLSLPAEGTAATPGGCAVRIPAGDAPVRVQGP
jgi:negative regulator of sigma E activity